MSEGMPQDNFEQSKPEEPHIGKAALLDSQQKVDENGYLSDGTQPSYVEDVGLAHEAANASNEDRSEAALHREQAGTYDATTHHRIYRDHHMDVAEALDTRAELKENDVLNQTAEADDHETHETIENPERERIEKLVELRAEAAKLSTALSGKSIESIQKSIQDVVPTNAYAETIYSSRNGGYIHPHLDDQAEYDATFYEKAKDLTYAQKFGVVSHGRFDAEWDGVEITRGWPDKYNRWYSSLGNTVEIDASNLLDQSTDEEGKVTFTVSGAAEQLDGDGQLTRFAERFSHHKNTFYARIESRPAIVIGQDKDGNVVAKAYFIVQVGDRSSKNLESVDLSAIDGVLQLANERIKPYSDDIEESKRLAGSVDIDAIRESMYEQAEARNRQFIQEFKASAPEFDDVTDADLSELLQLRATNRSSDYPEGLSEKQKLIFDALTARGSLTFATDSSGSIVDHRSVRDLQDRFDGVFEFWNLTATDKATKTIYKGSPWSPWGHKTEDKTDVDMSPQDITSLRKRVLEAKLNQSAA
ncbi:MAG: hypothetical protein QG629_378 [Patescibacteria group bacterium]|nr:hypothetical protein [Candidatus Saccharibacteria bacterium]MDQ5963296.1 hypothetical protein [Patescibacteria group bacterium]